MQRAEGLMTDTSGTPGAAGTDGSGIRVINRAADILFLLSRYPDGLSLREIARRVELPRSTVQRIAGALQESNFIIAGPTGGFRLGPALIFLAGAVHQLDIVSVVRPLLKELVGDLGETVDLSVLSHEKAVVVDQISGTHPLLAVSAVGTSLPLHASSAGKALLATLPAKEFQALRQRLVLEPVTENSKLDWDVLEKELEEVRVTGLAHDHEEYMIGISSAATVLRGPMGEVAAVSLPVPTERFDANEERIVKTLLERCRALQRRL